MLSATCSCYFAARLYGSRGARSKPTTTPKVYDPVIRNPTARRKLPTEVLRVTPAWSISGKIRWKKEYGVIPLGPGNSQAAAYPCGQNFVATMKTTGAPGSFGKLTTVAYTSGTGPNLLTDAPDEGDYHVCRYVITDLPANTNMVILAGFGGVLLLPEMDRDPHYWTDMWIGGSQPKPPPGSERAFVGGRSVTLTNAAPRATVDFEMVYQPIPQGPR